MITGIAVGMESTVFAALCIGASILAAYHIGASAIPGGGLFGTSVATMGMLSSAGVDVAPVEVHKLDIDFSATAPAGVYYALVNGASAGSMAA